MRRRRRTDYTRMPRSMGATAGCTVVSVFRAAAICSCLNELCCNLCTLCFKSLPSFQYLYEIERIIMVPKPMLIIIGVTHRMGLGQRWRSRKIAAAHGGNARLVQWQV